MNDLVSQQIQRWRFGQNTVLNGAGLIGCVVLGAVPSDSSNLTKDVVLEQLRSADVELLIVESENQYISGRRLRYP